MRIVSRLFQTASIVTAICFALLALPQSGQAALIQNCFGLTGSANMLIFDADGFIHDQLISSD